MPLAAAMLMPDARLRSPDSGGFPSYHRMMTESTTRSRAMAAAQARTPPVHSRHPSAVLPPPTSRNTTMASVVSANMRAAFTPDFSTVCRRCSSITRVEPTTRARSRSVGKA